MTHERNIAWTIAPMRAASRRANQRTRQHVWSHESVVLRPAEAAAVLCVCYQMLRRRRLCVSACASVIACPGDAEIEMMVSRVLGVWGGSHAPHSLLRGAFAARRSSRPVAVKPSLFSHSLILSYIRAAARVYFT